MVPVVLNSSPSGCLLQTRKRSTLRSRTRRRLRILHWRRMCAMHLFTVLCIFCMPSSHASSDPSIVWFHDDDMKCLYFTLWRVLRNVWCNSRLHNVILLVISQYCAHLWSLVHASQSNHVHMLWYSGLQCAQGGTLQWRIRCHQPGEGLCTFTGALHGSTKSESNDQRSLVHAH